MSGQGKTCLSLGPRQRLRLRPSFAQTLLALCQPSRRKCQIQLFGCTAAEVSAYLDEINIARRKQGWPESEWQAALVERFALEKPGKAG